MSGSSSHFGQGRFSKALLTEPITFPRKCACGYKLRPGEFASYMLGRWVCINCCSAERPLWLQEEEEVPAPKKGSTKMKQAVKP
jgi:hypothetical protein